MAEDPTTFDALIDELLDTTRYAGEVEPWRDVPETEASDDEPEQP